MSLDMRTFKFLLFTYLVLGLVSCQTEQKRSYTLVQYNVGVFDKYEGSSIDAAARAVKVLNADVVALNEVDSCTSRTGKVDQIAAFAATMEGWNHHYGAAMPYKGGAYGVGVASKPELKIVRKDVINFPKLDGYEPRAVALVEYEDFVFCATHLDLVESAQIAEIEMLNSYVESVYADCNKPIFLAGDLNCFPDSKPIEMLKQSWTLLTPTTFSFPSPAPDRCIDYIFVKPQGKKVSVNFAEIPTALEGVDLATASDHLPAVVEIVIE